MNDVPVWILLLSSVSSIFSCLTGWLAYSYTKKTTEMQRNDLIWQAYKDISATTDEHSIEYLLDISENEILALGLTKKQLKTYSIVTDVIWRRLQDNKDFDKIRNAICQSESVEESVDIILIKEWEPSGMGYTGRIIMTEGFAKAWPLLSKMWPREPSSLVLAYIEAGVKKGEINRQQLDKK